LALRQASLGFHLNHVYFRGYVKKTPSQLDAEIAEALTPKSEFKALGAYDVKAGFRIDGSVTMFWATKPQARAAAKSIGWPVNSIERVHTRFQMGYALKHTHGGFLTRAQYEELVQAHR
jgi:hypothetical protein